MIEVGRTRKPAFQGVFGLRPWCMRLMPGAPHGLTATHQDRINAQLLAFLKDVARAAA